MSSTVTDVEQALTDARVLEEYWMSNGWDALVLEEEIVSDEILDIYPLIETDISVNITIKLPNKIYTVPLEDVSFISVNDCLVIGISDLYPDWEERIETNLGYLIYETTITNDCGKWHEARYVGKDRNTRIVKLRASWVKGYIPLN